MHPEKIKFNQINFKPISDHEFSNNFKLFDKCLRSLYIDKQFDVNLFIYFNLSMIN